MGFQTKLQRINKLNGENIIKLKWIFIYEVHLEKMHQNEAITIYERYNIINDMYQRHFISCQNRTQ